MNRFYLSKLTILFVLLLGCGAGAFAQVLTFNYTGAVQTYTVPAAVTALAVNLQGAGGGNNSGSSWPSNGGFGGGVVCTLAVTGGQVLNIFVGGKGANATAAIGGAAGYNGGAAGGANGSYGGGGGGGATDIRIGGVGLGNRVIVAGGGGGAGLNCVSTCNGGNGGTTIGANGNGCGNTGYPTTVGNGQGGSASAGGGGGNYSGTNFGSAGGLGVGGASFATLSGGGGGGGYYGGGGAGGWAGAGGGSSYTDAVLCTGVVHSSGSNPNATDGTVTITVLCSPPVAGSIVGSSQFCVGIGNTLSNPTGSIDGIWTSSNTAIATVGSLTGTVTGVTAGVTTINYVINHGTCGTLTPNVNITVTGAPSPITGTNPICTNVPVTFSSLTTGGTWSSSNPSIAAINSTSGNLSGISTGVTTITYTGSTGCYITRVTTVNPSPNMYTITGGGSYCQGTGGMDIRLSGSDILVNYQLSNGITPVATLPGTMTYLDFGNQPAGVYSIIATNTNGGCTLAMSSPQTVVMNPVPGNDTVTGGGSYCSGGSGVAIGLTNSVSGVSYQLYKGTATIGAAIAGTGSAISFGSITGAGTYTAKSYYASTGCTTNASGNATITVNPLPANFNVTGGGNYCIGGAGVGIGLDGSSTGTTYQIYDGLTYGPSVIGTGGPITFGLITATNTYTARATTSFGCQLAMAGTAIVNTNPLPSRYSVDGGGSYCSGSTGIDITMPVSGSGINYQLFTGATAASSLLAGGTSTLDFGVQTTAGSYYVLATNPTTLCQDTMNGRPNVVVNALPTVYNVMGGGHYCSGDAGVSVKLDNSDTTASYTVYFGSAAVAGPIAGTGAMIDFGMFTNSGSYTIQASNIITGCTKWMNGSAVVTIDALPTLYNIIGGGGYCAGSAGAVINLSSSETTAHYQLVDPSGSLGSSVAGTGSSITFGPQTMAGFYTVKATNNTTGCSDIMAGTVNVTNNPLPTAYFVNGGGNYCVGGAGRYVGLSFSNVGIIYALYRNGTATGLVLVGTGLPLDFGLQTALGVYTVVATNNVTGCTANMNGSVAINTVPLPSVYSVSGTGSYCAGGVGLPIDLSFSDPGIDYQLFVGSTAVGSAINGTSAVLGFGLQTAPGDYTVVATNASTGCVSHMSGSAHITVNPLPAPYTVAGGGSYCDGGSGRNLGLTWADADISYQLYNGSLTSGAAITGAGTSISFGFRTDAGDYTVKATNLTTGCTNNMSGTATITVNPLPIVYTVVGGGNYCSGSTGVNVSLSGSNIGINYQLYLGSTMVGSAFAGSGGSIDFGAQTATGVYTVKATNTTAGCVSNMIGSATVGINPLPNVYTVSGGGTYCEGTLGHHINLSNSNTGIEYILHNGSATVGFPWTGTGSSIDFGTFAVPGTYTVVARNIITGCTSNMTASATLIQNPLVRPTVTVHSAAGDTVCDGTTATFHATSVHGGVTPTYQWSVNGAAITGANSTSFNYAVVNGDIVSATVTSSSDACASPNWASAQVAMTSLPNGLPDVSITANPGSNVCSGTTVLYTAAPVYGGGSPSYSWKVNGVIVPGVSGSSFSTTPANSDNIYCVMTSSYQCRVWPYASSNQIIMNTVDPVNPGVEIIVTPGTSITLGQNAAFVASVTNAGISPKYQWKIDGINVPGATNQVYASTHIANNNVVSCTVTSSDICGDHVGSNSVKMSVRNNVGVNQISVANNISVMPNPNKGAFTIKGELNNASVNDEEVTLEITNMLGQVVYSNKVMTQNGVLNEQVVLSNTIASGMYLLNIRSGADNTVVHIVVEQ